MISPGWIDRDERHPVNTSGMIELRNGNRYAVRVTNATNAGCQITCEETLPIGARLSLEVHGQTINADVRWALPGLAGLRII